MISESRATAVRRVMRQQGAVVVSVNQRVDDTEFDTSIYGSALGVATPRPETVDTLTDACLWVLADVRLKLATSSVFGSSRTGVLHKLFVGAVADWICYDQFGVDTLPQLVRFFHGHRAELERIIDSRDHVAALQAHLEAGATRDFLIALLDLVSTVPLALLLQRCDLPLPNRQPEPTPAIVKFFHPVNRPIQYWMSETIGGTVAFIVYFSPACTYKVCQGCALPDLSSQAKILPHDLIEQTDYVFRTAWTEEELASIRTLVISNNGSVLDEPTFPQSVLLHSIQVAAARMPKLKRISLETRAEFVTPEKLASIAKVIELAGKPDLSFELALGVEVFDKHLRNRVIRKGLSDRAIQALVKSLGEAGGDLRCYMMLKPVPGISDHEAVDDIDQAIRFFDGLSQEYGVAITLHINPTYAAVGTELETAFRDGSFTPPNLDLMIDYLKQASPNHVRLYFGLNDEGLAVEGGSFDRPKMLTPFHG